MSIDFSKVTAITTPSGSLSNIKRTSDLVQLWPYTPQKWTHNYIDSEGYLINNSTVTLGSYTDGTKTIGEEHVLLRDNEYFYRFTFAPNITETTERDTNNTNYFFAPKDSTISLGEYNITSTCEYAVLLYDKDGNIFKGSLSSGSSSIWVEGFAQKLNSLIVECGTNGYTNNNTPIRSSSKSQSRYLVGGYSESDTTSGDQEYIFTNWSTGLAKIEIYIRNATQTLTKI